MARRAFKPALIFIIYLSICTAAFCATQSTVPPVVDLAAQKNFIVIIDPGHGGGDWGAAAKGTHEKDITLALAKRLKQKIDQAGKNVTVFLTRSGDEFVKPEDRAAFANGKKAALFISIHCDFAQSGSAEGYKIFYENGERAKLEPDLQLIKWGEAQKYHIDESKKLASSILQYMRAALLPESKGGDENDMLPMQARKTAAVDSAILKSLDMPAVVIEAGNLNNNTDFVYLKDPHILGQMAYHIKEGIVNYLKEANAAEKGAQQ